MRVGNFRVPLRRVGTSLWTLSAHRLAYGGAAPLRALSVGARTTLDINEFHCRMGHIAMPATLKQAASDSGIVLTGELTDCIGCALGKSRRHAIPKIVHDSADKAFELVYTDCSFSSVRSLGGSNMWQPFVDSKTRFAAVYFGKSKTSTVTALNLRRFHNEMFLHRVACDKADHMTVRSDPGGEFAGAFDDACRDTNTMRERTSTNDPQRNSVAESFIRETGAKATALLQHAALGANMWAEAVSCVTYVYNRTPHSTTGVSPYESLYGRKPDLARLHTFGRLGFVHKRTHGKFQSRSTPAVFVGYALGKPSDCLRMFIPSTNSIVETQHVTIHDDVMFMDSKFNKANTSSDLAPGDGMLSILFGDEMALGDVNGAGANAAAAGDGGGAQDAGGALHGGNIPDNAPHPADGGAAGGGGNDAGANLGNIGGGAAAAAAAAGVRTRHQAAMGPPAPVLQLDILQRSRGDGAQRTVPQRALPPDNRALMVTSVSDFAHCHHIQEPFMDFNYAYMVSTTEVPLAGDPPASYGDINGRPDADRWYAAVEREMGSFTSKGAMTLVRLPDDADATPSMFLFSNKLDANGDFLLSKCRLVAKGCYQTEGVHYSGDISSPVASMDTVRLFLAKAAHDDLVTCHVDVNTAFLHAFLPEPVYVRPPPGMETRDNDGAPLVWRMTRAIYGTRNAPKCWNTELNAAMVGFGFTRSDADPCLYVKYAPRGGESAIADVAAQDDDCDITMVIIFVDDLAIAASSPALVDAFVVYISNACDCKVLGELSHFLGMRVRRDRDARTITLDQTAYVERVLAKFGMADCTAVTSPADATVLTSDMSPSTATEAAAMASVPYKSAVGSVMYAATCTRPDVYNAVRCTARFMANPGEQHWAAVLRILKYLRGTSHYALTLGSDAIFGSNQLVAFSDADHATCRDTRRSTTGYIVMYGTAPVAFASRTQPVVALSSTEAELYALSETVAVIMYLLRILRDMGVAQRGPVTVYGDNQSALYVATSSRAHRKMKHVDTRYHFIKDEIERGTIDLVFVPTKEQLADCLTKNATTCVIKHFVDFFFNTLGERMRK